MSAAMRQDADSVAQRKATLQEDLDRMLRWRGPVTEVRRLVAELDRLDFQMRDGMTRADCGQDRLAG